MSLGSIANQNAIKRLDEEIATLKQTLTEFSTKNTENLEAISKEFKKVEVVINNHAGQIAAAEKVLKIIVKVLGIGDPPTVGGH